MVCRDLPELPIAMGQVREQAGSNAYMVGPKNRTFEGKSSTERLGVFLNGL